MIDELVINGKATTIKQQALDKFKEVGFPTLKNDSFRYLPLKKVYERLNASSKDDFESFDIKDIIDCCDNRVIIVPMEQAFRRFNAFIARRWKASIKQEEKPFVLLNTIFYGEGVFVYIPPGAVVDQPIHVTNTLKMSNPRIHIFVGKDAQVSFVDELGGNREFSNVVWDVHIDDNAHVSYYNILTEKPGLWSLSNMNITMKKRSSLKAVSFVSGISFFRQDLQVDIQGENCDLDLRSGWMLKDREQSHYNVNINHHKPLSASKQLFKGVLDDMSRSSFRGAVHIDSIAQQTDAHQLNNNLMLSDNAFASSLPILKVFADDVKAAHGSTAGQLDLELLFYLTSRGIPQTEAKKLLVKGFVKDVVDAITIELLQEKVSQSIMDHCI